VEAVHGIEIFLMWCRLQFLMSTYVDWLSWALPGIFFQGGKSARKFAYKFTFETSTIFWDMTPCSPLSLPPACSLVPSWTYFSTLKMEAICSFETSVDTQRTTWCYIPEDGIVHNHRCENLKSYLLWRGLQFFLRLMLELWISTLKYRWCHELCSRSVGINMWYISILFLQFWFFNKIRGGGKISSLTPPVAVHNFCSIFIHTYIHTYIQRN
jgi:hypothetical protein